MLFKGVFDRSQVAPIDGTSQAPLEPPRDPLTGDWRAHLIDPMRVFAESLGIVVGADQLSTSKNRTWGCDRPSRVTRATIARIR